MKKIAKVIGGIMLIGLMLVVLIGCGQADSTEEVIATIRIDEDEFSLTLTKEMFFRDDEIESANIIYEFDEIEGAIGQYGMLRMFFPEANIRQLGNILTIEMDMEDYELMEGFFGEFYEGEKVRMLTKEELIVELEEDGFTIILQEDS